MDNFKQYFSELLGTFILTFIGTSTFVIFGGGKGGVVSIIGIAIAFGLSLTVTSHIFNVDTNPAVSLSRYFEGDLLLSELFFNIIFQIIGALLASLLLAAILLNIPDATISSYGLAQNGFESESAVNITLFGAILVEVVLSALFILIILFTKDKDSHSSFIKGIIYTLTHLIGTALTGTSLNPARSLAPAIVLLFFNQSKAISQVWVFLIAPLVGSLIATIIYKALHLED